MVNFHNMAETVHCTFHFFLESSLVFVCLLPKSASHWNAKLSDDFDWWNNSFLLHVCVLWGFVWWDLLVQSHYHYQFNYLDSLQLINYADVWACSPIQLTGLLLEKAHSCWEHQASPLSISEHAASLLWLVMICLKIPLASWSSDHLYFTTVLPACKISDEGGHELKGCSYVYLIHSLVQIL